MFCCSLQITKPFVGLLCSVGGALPPQWSFRLLENSVLRVGGGELCCRGNAVVGAAQVKELPKSAEPSPLASIQVEAPIRLDDCSFYVTVVCCDRQQLFKVLG